MNEKPTRPQKTKRSTVSKRHKLSPHEERWKKIALWFCGIFLTLFIGELVFYLVVWNINDWASVLLLQIILIMPAYISNAGMLLFGKGGNPLDKEKVCKDGNRLFGPGKTLKGLIWGPVFGIVVSLSIHAIFFFTWEGIENIILAFWGGERVYILFNSTPEVAVDLFKVYMIGTHWNEKMWMGFIRLFIRVALVSFGAAGGDLFGSWLKRRLNKNRGEPVWGLDQLDFIVPAVLISMPFIIINLEFIAIFVFIMIFTPSMAVIANVVSYYTGLKEVPY